MESLLPQKETSSLQLHAPIVRVAAKALADKNIPVMEYGQQIQWRNGDPVALLVRTKIFLWYLPLQLWIIANILSPSLSSG